MSEIDDVKEKAFAAIKKSVAESSEDWHTQLVDKYQNLKNVSNDNLPGLWDSLEFELSIQKILNIADCTLPFAGIVLGSPSSLKTVGIELFRRWHSVFYTDSFSAKAFVSRSTAVKIENLAKIDMLPKIKNKLLLTPELSPTFAKKDDDLIEILGILTRVLDGHGYESDTGAHGHRGYNEPMMFVWIGAAVDIPYKVHKYLGTLGPKLYFKRLRKLYKKEQDYYNELDKNFADKIDKVSVALFDYIEWFESCPDMMLDEERGHYKMTWLPEKDDPKAKRYIIRLAMLLAHLRGVVVLIVRDEKGAQGTDSIKVSINDIESNTDTTDNNNIGTVQKNDNTNTNTNTNNNPNPTSTATTNSPGLENTTSKALTNAQNALRNNGSRVITPSSEETQISRSAAFTPLAISTAVSAVQADNIVNIRTAYDIIFRTASAGAIKTVEMTFPQGTNIGSATMLEVSGIGQGGTSVGGPNGLTLIYTVAIPVNVPSGIFLRFEACKILNPSTPGTYTVQVVTRDSGGAEIDSGTSASYQIKQITTNDIADNAILSTKIGDGQVSTADIAGNSITGAKIQDGQVGTVDLTNAAITTAKIAPGAIQPQTVERSIASIRPPGSMGLENVQCNVGEVVTGGGFFVDDTHMFVQGSGQYGNGYYVQILNTDNVQHDFEVSAMCLKLTP